MPENPRGEAPSDGRAVDFQAKGVLKSLSEGVRNLLILDEKFHTLGKEGDRTRADIKMLQEIVFRFVGRIDEMDKRISERFGELDKRLSEIDKRIEMSVELAVRKHLER